MQKTFLKIKDHWLFWLFTIILGVLLSKLIDKIEFSPNKYWIVFITLLKFKVQIPLLGFIVGAVLAFFGLKGYKKYFIINKRKLKIINATYGLGDKVIDITNELNKSVIDNELKIVLSNNIAGDPAFHSKKEGLVKYEFIGQTQEKKYQEGELIELP